MPLKFTLDQLASTAVAAVTVMSLTACGGGGAGADQIAAPAAAPPTVIASPAPTTNTPTEPTVAAVATYTATPAETLLAAIASTTVATALSPEPSAKNLIATANLSKTDTPTETVQSVNAALAIDASTVGSLSAGSRSGLGTGRVFYVDSKIGNDSNNGRAASGASGGVGPWRSLATVTLAGLAAGDTVRLACGSEWNETLKLNASGTTTNPISLVAYPAGCAAKPQINGGVSIAASDWTQYKGNIYKAPLPGTALQITGGAGSMTIAHHPNRGADTSLPDSVYLRLAANSDSVKINNYAVSTFITTGPDLTLPTGASLTAGTTVRIRTNSWTIDERKISAVNGNRVTVTTPTSYPLMAGWGYYFTGQLWMLDSPGEWYHDTTAHQLYVWMPDSRPPSTALLASQLATGIDVESSQYIVIDGLAVKSTGTGINLRRSVGVTVRNCRIEDTAGLGANAAGSQAALIDTNAFSRTGGDAISGQENNIAAAATMRVLNNTVTDSGVVISGTTTSSLPTRSNAAIRPGTGAVVDRNTITNTGYIGIWALANSTISNNVIGNTCAVLDDCGAIYSSGATNNSVISGNLIQHVIGTLAGKAPQFAYTQTQGIYLDESASGITVSGNTIIDADNGVHVHVSANNVIKDNKLYGNRNAQIWMQETRNSDNPMGDVFNNSITGNQIVPILPTARGIFLDTNISDTSRFGVFNWNRYFDRVFTTVAVERSPASSQTYNLFQWKSAISSNGTNRALDTNGTGISETNFAAVLINGTNIVPNGNLAVDTKGWFPWNLTAPFGTISREPCPAGICARYVTGGSPGVMSSPNFSIIAGTWYRLSADLATGADGQTVNLVVRRGGGGTNGYESLSDRSLWVKAGRTWARYSIIFKATKSITAADPFTKDLGARVDIQNIAPGDSTSIANLELVPITPSEALTRNDILLNPGSSTVQLACPVAATQPTLCGLYVRFSDNLPVTWPYSLPARSSEIIYTRDARLVDTDGDGIPDSQDQCAYTVLGSNVDSRGCSLAQRV